MHTKQTWKVTLTIAIVAASMAAMPTAWAQRDRGINQPGAAGNKGVGADPGLNQPGAAGNAGGAGVRDPGVNQPGTAGNAGAAKPAKDKGVNQPGAAGNRSARGAKDAGKNQPGAAGNAVPELRVPELRVPALRVPATPGKTNLGLPAIAAVLAASAPVRSMTHGDST